MKKKADGTVEDIMKEKGIDREAAWGIKQQRDDDKYRRAKHNEIKEIAENKEQLEKKG